MLNGRKLVGSAQVRRRFSLLQHGSILFQPQVEALLACLSLTDQQRGAGRIDMAESVAGLDDLGREINWRDLASAITRAFVKEFGWQAIPSRLSPAESEAARIRASKPMLLNTALA